LDLTVYKILTTGYGMTNFYDNSIIETIVILIIECYGYTPYSTRTNLSLLLYPNIIYIAIFILSLHQSVIIPGYLVADIDPSM